MISKLKLPDIHTILRKYNGLSSKNEINIHSFVNFPICGQRISEYITLDTNYLIAYKLHLITMYFEHYAIFNSREHKQ